MRLNLGCGFRKLNGWHNVDKMSGCSPDEVVDLEQFPWPWPDSSSHEVLLIHVLEHIGDTSAVFLQFIKELWRISQPNADIDVLVPHPRCDEFLWDPTHVRAITPEGLRMFSQMRNRQIIEKRNPETPLGIYLGVDFEIVEVRYIWRQPWAAEYDAGRIKDKELSEMLLRNLNVAMEIEIKMRALKPAGSSSK